MSADFKIQPPACLEAILAETASLGFSMGSNALTGSLLRALAATKPGGRLLELGTGTGLSAAWLLEGMDLDARLTSVDNDGRVQEVAKRYFGRDQRCTFVAADGGDFLQQWRGGPFDLMFADAWPGKYSHLRAALDILATGGLYVVDDLLPQPNWPPGHQANVDLLLEALAARQDLLLTKLDWSTGSLIAAKRSIHE